jgi:hypothetical protein
LPRVPSGATPSNNSSLSLNLSAICATSDCGAPLSTGIPPSPRKNQPHGGAKSVCLPIQDARTPKTYAAASMKGKSQFDVWGAAMKTHFLKAVASP